MKRFAKTATTNNSISYSKNHNFIINFNLFSAKKNIYNLLNTKKGVFEKIGAKFHHLVLQPNLYQYLPITNNYITFST